MASARPASRLRQFAAGLLILTAARAVQAVPTKETAVNQATLPEPSSARLPRWRGFNLLEKFSRDWNNGPFKESDVQMMHA